MWVSVVYLLCPVMWYFSLVNMESAESDVGLSGLFTLSWHVVTVNIPLRLTSDSADFFFTKLQYYLAGQGK
jgi:hypothetical protein